MYIRSVEIQDVRSIEHLSWSIASEPAAGWHVVLGDNGSGKSTFLRAIALALAGDEGFYGLRLDIDTWRRTGAQTSSVRIVGTRDDGFDFFAKAGRPPAELSWSIDFGIDYSNGPEGTGDFPNPFVHADRPDVGRGWFCAGFGPFRRFSGSEAVPESKTMLGRYLSLFDERFALSSALEWLADLHHASLSASMPAPAGFGVGGFGQAAFGSPSGPAPHNSARAFEAVKQFINQPEFLPHGVRLETVIPPRQIVFRDGSNAMVSVLDLSDGFRSVLSLTLELLRQLILAFGLDRVLPVGASTVPVPGVVLIDEVDAHLHPTWQRTIGNSLTRAFPAMQFIVTTHSPLVCCAAEHGSIFLLPEHGTSGPGRFVSETERKRLVFGNVLDALSTGVFGHVSQSDTGMAMRTRLAELNTKELSGVGLSPAEEAERDELRADLPSRASTLNAKG